MEWWRHRHKISGDEKNGRNRGIVGGTKKWRIFGSEGPPISAVENGTQSESGETAFLIRLDSPVIDSGEIDSGLKISENL